VIIGGDKGRKRNVIIGGDSSAIIGGDSDVIIGGDRSKTASTDVIIGGDNRALRNALAIGPVESVDRSANTFKVLGQSYKAVGSVDAFAALADSQQLIAVIADAKSPGGLTPKAVLKLKETYVAGSTKVMLKGKVSSVDVLTGTLMIGRQVVDITATLSDSGRTPSTGDTIAVVGIQPAAGGVLLASEIR
jgi:hypothetical protein